MRKVLSSKIVHENPTFRVEEREVEVRGGQQETHWMVVRTPGVQVVALSPENKIVLIKERAGADKEYRIDLPGGKCNRFDMEIPELQEKAHKELEEEAGYRAGSIEYLMIDSRSSSWLERDFYIFIAWDLEYVGPHQEPGEQIIPFAISLRDIDRDSVEMQLPDYLNVILHRALSFYRQRGLISG